MPYKQFQVVMEVSLVVLTAQYLLASFRKITNPPTVNATQAVCLEHAVEQSLRAAAVGLPAKITA